MPELPTYLNEADLIRALYFKKDNYLIEKAEFHESLEFIFVIKGKTEAYIGNEKHIIDEGCAFFADSFQPHRYKVLTEEFESYVVVLGPEYTDSFRKIYNGMAFPTELNDKEKNKFLFAILDQWMSEESKTFLKNMGVICFLLSKIADYYPLVRVDRPKDDSVALTLIRYVNDHFTEDISLNSLASDIGYSVEYCSKTLNKVTGRNFREYLNLLRYRKVEELLNDQAHSSISISEALAMAGFNSPVTYYRAKKKYESSAQKLK
ncbi:MAG: AraC family transcriptional regulator [Bacilli bacterium]|nr:AraC family transcriptional regulator [Bacilli bacterium]